jgi:hypothetical protein
VTDITYNLSHYNTYVDDCILAVESLRNKYIFKPDSVQKLNMNNSGFASNIFKTNIPYCRCNGGVDKILHEFSQVDQFIRIQISFYFLCVSYWSIGSETKSN